MIVMFNTFDQIPLSGLWEHCFFLFIYWPLPFNYFITNTYLPSKGYIFINLNIVYVTEKD